MSEVILSELKAACGQHPEWAPLAAQLGNPQQGLHLAILRQPYLGYVLDGSKTIESRFSVNRISPFGQVAVDDLVLLKGAGGVVGAFTATATDFRQVKTPGDLAAIKQEYGPRICAPKEFWQAQSGKHFATLIGVGQVMSLPPVKVTKRDMRGWVVLRSSGQPQLLA